MVETAINPTTEAAHHEASERLLTALDAVGSTAPGGVVWLAGDDGPERRAVWQGFHARLIERSTPRLAVDCERPLPLPFEPVKDLLRQLLPVIEREAPFLLVEFGPELIVLLPELQRHPYLRDALRLDEIALGGTKRRLHKDSEQLFRLVYAFASLVLEAKANCPSLVSQPLALTVDNLDAADRPTLSCLYHLAQRIGDAAILLVVAAPDPSVSWLDRPWLWADGYDDGISVEVAALTDAYAEQQRLLQRVFAGLSAERIDVSTTAIDIRPVDGALMALSAAARTRLELEALGADRELAQTLSGLEQDSVQDDLDAILISRARRSAVRRLMPPDRRRALHDQIAGHLAAQPSRSEAARTRLVFHAVRAGRADAADLAIEAAGAVLSFSMSFESLLFCCRDALGLAVLSEAPIDRARAVAAWQLVGVAQSYLERQEGALKAFELAAGQANQPESRAQTSYYAGLVAAKRSADRSAGAAWFERGLEALETTTAPEAMLERGWLHNGLAFIAWQDRRYTDAEALVEEALAFIEPFSDPQSLNLQVNLLNNLSLLHEEQGDLAGALATWRRIGHWAAELEGGTFAKSYYYREGWLLLQADDLAGAHDALLKAFEIARAVRDFFHMDLISRASGYVACRLRMFEEAFYWYEYNQMLRARLDDRRHLADAWAALGHAAVQAGDMSRATVAFQSGEAAASAVGQVEQADLLRAARNAAAGSESFALDVDGEFHGVQLDRPKAKLTSPFALGHLSSRSSFAPHTHTSVAGGPRS